MAQSPQLVNGTTVEVLRASRWVRPFEKAPSLCRDWDSTSKGEGPAPPLKSFRNVHIFER